MPKNWDSILEEMRRKAYDAVKDDIEEHGIKTISNSVEDFRDKGLRLAIILTPPKEH